MKKALLLLAMLTFAGCDNSPNKHNFVDSNERRYYDLGIMREDSAIMVFLAKHPSGNIDSLASKIVDDMAAASSDFQQQ